MMCSYKKYTLHFKKPGGTSRGVLYNKDTYFLILKDGEKTAYGECNLFRKLSYDDSEGYEQKLSDICKRLPVEKEEVLNELTEWPSIRFGVETVLKDWANGCHQIIFPGVIKKDGFTIPINGLVWMGTRENMQRQIAVKLKEGYRSIKLKVGAIDFDKELELLRYMRQQFTSDQLEIRVDANGAFGFREAKEKIERMAAYDINYIEQPIKAGNWQEMAALAKNSPIKIALDEELIGVNSLEEKKKLMETIQPPILILKPALAGGFASCDEWRRLAEDIGGLWVVTSALESNIGLNAIAQYAVQYKSIYAQGLGTGQLYTNNISAPYTVDAKGLHYHQNKNWDFSPLQ